MSTAGPLAVPVTVADRAAERLAADAARVERAVAAYSQSVWRALRRFGLAEADADDGVQQVFAIFVRRLAVVAEDRERAFLLGCAARVASECRRAHQRRREEPTDSADFEMTSGGPSPEHLLERKRGLHTLDRVISTLPSEQRAVFVLYEIEGLTLAEIGEALGLKLGTAASRLHRARARFEKACRALEATR
jgi:RNA polymerase sigma-70 factor, ECF subfamily